MQRYVSDDKCDGARDGRSGGECDGDGSIVNSAYAQQLLAPLALASLEFARALGGGLILENPREAALFARPVLQRPVREVALADTLQLTHVLLHIRISTVCTVYVRVCPYIHQKHWL